MSFQSVAVLIFLGVLDAVAGFHVPVPVQAASRNMRRTTSLNAGDVLSPFWRIPVNSVHMEENELDMI